MTSPQDLEAALRATLDDQRLSRSERKGLQALVAGATEQQLAHYRHLAFKIARAELGDEKRDRNLVDWLEDAVKALHPRDDAEAEVKAAFSPGEEPLKLILGLLSSARKSCDICVFTITDDRISDAIIATHKRGVAVRVISDNDKAEDRGSDVDRLERAGVPTRVDRTDHHMHHKFALFDGQTLLSGSYNWTRSACRYNHENILTTSHPRLLTTFGKTFEQLWERLG